MDFKDFIPKENEDLNNCNEKNSLVYNKINQDQVYDVITSKKHDWQDLIYELINSEQLDPWDIDLVFLTKKYFEKIALLDDVEFYISSKVLLAAAFLLRIKSEILLNKHIRSIDEILFGKKQEQKSNIEKIRINEDDLPILLPRTPLSRLKRVTLPELINALNKAINTEVRRIKREVAIKRAKKLSEVDFPTFKRIDLKDRIKALYARILTKIKKISVSIEKEHNKIPYSNLIGLDREEKLTCFLPLLHLSNTQKLWLEQKDYLGEIYIYLYEYFASNRNSFIEDLNDVIEEINEELTENIEQEPELLNNLKEEEFDIKKLKEELDREEAELPKEDKLEILDKITNFNEEKI
jgi:segregation and condensation protein A